MNPASNFACYRTMFKVATERQGGRVSNILPPSIQSSPRLGFANCDCYFVFSLNSLSLSSACLSKMFIFLMRVTQTGWDFFLSLFYLFVCLFVLKCFMKLLVLLVYLIYLCFLFSFCRLPNGHINFEVDGPLYYFVNFKFVVCCNIESIFSWFAQTSQLYC